MRTTKFSTILASVARLYGEGTLTEDDAATVAASLDSDRIEQCWAYADWREIDVIEQRYFADDYSATAAYLEGALVYDPTTELYYTCTAASTGNAPTDTVYWTASTGFSKTVAFVQSGKTPIGTVNDVTLHDPRRQPGSAPVTYIRREDSIQVAGTSQSSVWIRFTRRAPRFTTAPYAVDTTYALGDLVYDATTGHCYESLDDANLGNAVTDIDYWQAQEIPHFALGFLIRGALADLYDSQEQDDKAQRQEAKAFEKLDDAYYIQNRREGTVTRVEVLGTNSSGQDEPAISNP